MTHGANDQAAHDRAGTEYWDEVWKADELPNPVDPTLPSLDNVVNAQFDALFRSLFAERQSGRQLLEVGAARSAWLPYFAQQFGFRVTGLDYSVPGCEQTEQILERAGVNGTVHRADMFDPPSQLRGAFDVVVSLGLVEHFDDTSAAVNALAAFVAPGGLLITSVPNMAGLLGLLQRGLDPAVFRVHKPITRRDLAAAHIDSGLDVVSSRYLMTVNWSAVNIANWPKRRRARAMRLLSGASKVVWMAEARGLRLPPNRWTSPYIVAVGSRRPEPGALEAS